MEFNRLISNVEPSKSVTLLAKTKELQKTDPEILNLTGGEPDFPTPKAVCDTVVAELAAGHTHYSDSRGDADLRARIARKLQEENHAPYQAENILITPGAKYAVYLTIRALINPVDVDFVSIHPYQSESQQIFLSFLKFDILFILYILFTQFTRFLFSSNQTFRIRIHQPCQTDICNPLIILAQSL